MIFQNDDSQKAGHLEMRLQKLEEKLINIPEIVKDSLRNSLDELLSSSLTISCIKEEIDRRYKRSRAELSDFTKDLEKSEKEVKETQKLVLSLEKDFSNTRNLISDILIDLKLKAYTGDVNQVEKKLESKCSNATVAELAGQLKNMAKHEELQLIQVRLESLNEIIHLKYFRKNEAFEELKKIETKLYSTLEAYTTREQTASLNQKFYKKFKKVQNVSDVFENSLNSFKENFSKLGSELKLELVSKVGYKDVEKINNELAVRVTKVELNKYLAQINPKISGFESELGTFSRVLREHEQALLRFDELLLEKASKLESQDLYQKLDQISKHSNIEYKIDDMLSKFSKTQDCFEDLQSDMRKIKLEFGEILTLYSKKANDGIEIRFLKELMLDMQTNISYKADRTEILNYLEKKAGWGDFTHLTQSLESVHRQIKLLAVQGGALEKITTPSGKLRNAEKSQREYFNKITNRLVNYVVSSKPTTEENPVPEELKAFLKLPETPKVKEHIKRISTPHRRTHHSFDFLNKAGE